MSAVLRLPARLRPLAPYGLAGASVLAAAWVELLVARSQAAPLGLLPLMLAVAFGVWRGGLGPGLFALVMATVAADLIVLGPGGLSRAGTPESVIVLGGFLSSGLVICLMGHRVHRRVERERAGRLDAQRVAAQADRTAQLAVALSQARTPGAAIEAALQEPLHALGADAAAMFLVSRDGTRAEIARAIGYPADAAPAGLSLRDKTPVADAVGRGAAVVLESSAAREREYGDAATASVSQPFGATAAIPLLVGSRVVAVAEFAFAAPRSLSEADHDYLEGYATRAAAALDRTWQYEDAVRARADAEAQRARADQEIAEREKTQIALRASEARGRALAARTSRFHGLTAALSESVTVEAVARAVVQQGRVAAGATSAEVMLLDAETGALRTIFAEGAALARAEESSVEPGSCAADAIQTRQPVFVASFEEWQEHYPASASRAADGGYVSSATVPLLVEGQAIGVLACHFTAPVNFDDEYRAVLISIAQHGAQALDRARLYEAAQQARSAAEAANRLKDEFVSIVSHELRSPLNAILGWTSMLIRGAVDPQMTPRALQSVHDNATRQARLIEELLDFSRLASGRLALVREPLEIRDLVRGVVEAVIPDAVAKGVELELAPVPSLCVIGDLRRLEQVFFNLLGNALKFTPSGGRITVAVRRQEDSLLVLVADTGRGIEPEFLPFVFDRFRQGDAARDREHGGLGLGLSIARQLVEAHDGDIRVESAGQGKGTTFSVRLPLAAAPDRPVVALRG